VAYILSANIQRRHLGGEPSIQVIYNVLDGQVITASVAKNLPREVWVKTGLRGNGRGLNAPPVPAAGRFTAHAYRLRRP
jgi:hypothetical protein